MSDKKEYNRKYHEEHKQERRIYLNAKAKEYYQKNKEIISQKGKDKTKARQEARKKEIDEEKYNLIINLHIRSCEILGYNEEEKNKYINKLKSKFKIIN